MDKRLSTGRLITDRLILKSLKGAAAAVAVWSGLGYACHFVAERSRVEESAIEAKIAVARRVLADTVGEPFAGGSANCQRLRSVLEGTGSIVTEVNGFSENVIAEKCGEAENKIKRIMPSARSEAATMLGQLRQLKIDYASSRGEFNRRFAVVIGKANDAIQKRVSLERKLNQYRTGLKSVIDKSERGSSYGDGKQLLDDMTFMDVRGMKTSAVIAKACSEVKDSWAALSDADKVVADMISQVETAKKGIRSTVNELNTFVASAEELHTRFMKLPAVKAWEHSAEWYRNECRVIVGKVRRYMKGPYFYDKTLAKDLLETVSELQGKVAETDSPEPVELYRNLQMKYNEFTSNCTWRQGVAHPQVSHVISSSTPNQWMAETGWEFVNPGTSDLTVRRKAPIWAKPKEWYERECAGMEKNVRLYTSGGYRYPRGGDAGVVRQIQNLRQRLNADDPEGSARAYSELKDTYSTFVNQCHWTSGLRHPRFPHVVSGMTANQWVAENGWEFVSPGTGDLSVRRIPKAVKCSKCQGKCIYNIRVTCAVCKGARYVSNPVALVGTAVNFGLNTVRRRGRGRNLPSHIPTGPSKGPCSGCNAHGFVYNQIQCEQCGGTGIIYR